jgi:hypothetical protein
MKELPFAPASERNKHPILEQLRSLLPRRGRLLEIGAGTGQHAVFFAPEFPGLEWQCSEHPDQLPGLRARLEAEGQGRLAPPLALDVLEDAWPEPGYDAVFSANTAHIMPWPAVCAMLAGVGRSLLPGGCFCLYGPFNVDGAFTAPSNAEFDAQLRMRDALMGIRDMHELATVAALHQMALTQRISMPANNFLLVFQRAKGSSPALSA